MKKKIFLIFFCTCVPSLLWAEGEKTEYTDKIIACIDSKNPNSITEYVCPQVQEDTRAIRSYQAAVSLLFHPIDEEVEKKLKELGTKRSKNLGDWSETIRMFSSNPPPHARETAFVTRYLSGCQQAIREVHIARGLTTDATVLRNLPDGIDTGGCHDLVTRKLDAYSHTAWMIASRYVGRTFTNDQNTWMDGNKTKYSELLDSFNRYINTLQSAMRKINARVKTPSIAPNGK